MTARIARRSAGLALIVVAVSIAGAPQAHATTDEVDGSNALAGGPALGGDAVVWLADTGDGVVIERNTGHGGTEQVLSRTFTSYEDEETGDFSHSTAGGFAASGSFALLDTKTASGTRKYFQYDYATRTEAVRFAGRVPRTIDSCSTHIDAFNGPAPSSARPPSAPPVIDGDRAITLCSGPKVVDLRSGAALGTLPSLGDRARLAGRFVASAQGDIVVYDWQAEQEAYRIAILPTTKSVAFDLASDGTVVTVQFTGPPSCATGVLRRHSAADPAGATAAVAPCTANVAVDGDKAVIVAAAQSPGPAGQVLAAVGVDGTRLDLGWLGTGRRRTGEIDYGGGTVVYALRTCDGRVAILRAHGGLQRQPTDCLRLRLTRARIVHRRLRVAGTADRAFTGMLRVVYRVRVGATTRSVQGTARVRDGAFAATLPLPSWIDSPDAAARGAVALRFGGDAIYKRDVARRRVATP
jgi:hypothetical protein